MFWLGLKSHISPATPVAPPPPPLRRAAGYPWRGQLSFPVAMLSAKRVGTLQEPSLNFLLQQAKVRCCIEILSVWITLVFRQELKCLLNIDGQTMKKLLLRKVLLSWIIFHTTNYKYSCSALC